MTRVMIGILIVLVTGSLARAGTLDDYLVLAAKNNPGLKARYAQYEAALARIPQARSLPDPTLSFGYFISPVETRVGPQKARLSLTQMFPWFGTLKNRGDAAAFNAEALFQAFVDARNALYVQVTEACYSLYEARRFGTIETENINLLEHYRTLAVRAFEQSRGGMADVLRVDLRLEDARTERDILDAKDRALVAAVNALLNRPENETVTVNDPSDVLIPEPLTSLPDLLARHPAVRAYDSRIKAGEAGERVARLQGYPKLGLGLDYVMVDRRDDMAVEDNGQDALMAMVTVSIPLFRTAYRASASEARQMLSASLLEKEALANDLRSRYESVFFEMDRQRRLIDLYDRQIQTTGEALDLLLSAYSQSGKDIEEVLTMQQQLLTYEKMKTTARVKLWIALARLDYLTGGDDAPYR